MLFAMLLEAPLSFFIAILFLKKKKTGGVSALLQSQILNCLGYNIKFFPYLLTLDFVLTSYYIKAHVNVIF